ncbi:hypothetical protein Y1Q_0014537 [Alligator mississippiensis]|uniref:Uncharacterized protein n=1 Tax=Alligator mississippiensis TaxID=8496 RepID=A0A151PDH5_ALLMI|nr:hypothetical protein Y1Q_0014537 [Alligator mississippiensis]
MLSQVQYVALSEPKVRKNGAQWSPLLRSHLNLKPAVRNGCPRNASASGFLGCTSTRIPSVCRIGAEKACLQRSS